MGYLAPLVAAHGLHFELERRQRVAKARYGSLPSSLRAAMPANVVLKGPQFLGRGRKFASPVEINTYAFSVGH